MSSPKSPFLPTKEELKELDRKDGFDRTPPKKTLIEKLDEAKKLERKERETKAKEVEMDDPTDENL